MMPLSDGNPFALARLAPGIAYNGDLKFSRPFDNGGTSGIVTGGATGGNEFTLDGSPNMANGRRVAFVPPAGAVQEFKVETASFDAASGHTGGRHRQRDAQERHQRAEGIRLHLLPLGEARGDRLLRSEERMRRSRSSSYKRPGFTLGGPVVIPGLYDGHDRASSSAALEWLYDEFPEPPSRRCRRRRCATAISRRCWRRASSSTIPLTAQTLDGDTSCASRSPATSSRPAGINADRAEGAQLLPAAEPDGGRQRAEQLLLCQPAHRRFLFGVDALRSHGHVEAAADGALHAQRSPRGAQRGVRRGQRPRADRQLPVPQERRRHREPHLDAELTLAVGRSAAAGSSSGSRTSASTKACSIRRRWASRARGRRCSAARTTSRSSTSTRSATSATTSPATLTHSIYSFQPTYTRLAGNHSIRAGYDLRHVPRDQREPGRQAGDYACTNSGAFTRQTNNSAAQNFQDVATFLTGLPDRRLASSSTASAPTTSGTTASSCRTTGS